MYSGYRSLITHRMCAGIFLASLWFFKIVTCEEQVFHFDEIKLISFSPVDHAFGILFKKSLPNPSSQR